MTNPNASNQKVGDNALIALEKEIANTISPIVLNYVFLLDPEQNYQVQMSTSLTKNQLTLLQSYNSAAIKLLNKNGIETELKTDDVFEKFKSIQKDIYTLRYIQAKKYFASYAFVRIPTLEEKDLARLVDESDEIQIFLEIYIPAVIKLLDNGSVDLDATSVEESDTNTIAATMSSYSNYIDLANRMLKHIFSISDYVFLVSFNQSELIELFKNLLQPIVIQTNKDIYNYIKRGFKPKEAISNVKSLNSNEAEKNPRGFYNKFDHIDPLLNEFVENMMSKNKLDRKVVTNVVKDIVDLLVLYHKEGYTVSENYYKIKFIDYKDISPIYSKYHHLMEIYLYDDVGDTLGAASELYDIRFSTEFKRMLFNFVTGGIENPYLTLDEYLLTD